MTSTKNTYHPITAETCGMKFKGKYKKLRKGVYKLIMELPFKFERVYKEDILEIDDMVDSIMRQEMVEIFDDYYVIKENSSIFNNILSGFNELANAESLPDSEIKLILSELYDRYIPAEKQYLNNIKFQFSPNEIRYLLSLKI